MYVYIHICICVYMCVYICVYIYIKRVCVYGYVCVIQGHIEPYLELEIRIYNFESTKGFPLII